MSLNTINLESYREILSEVEETISKFKNNNNEKDSKLLTIKTSKTQIINENRKNIDNIISELQIENSNLKYENDFLKRQNTLFEESLNKLKNQFETLKLESNSIEERLNNLNIIKEKNVMAQDERYYNYINEIEEQFEILKRDNCLLVERQKGIDDFLHSKKDLFTKLGISINDDENQIIDISLFEELINHLIGINQKISKDLDLYKSQNKDLLERLENAINSNKELNEKIENNKIDKSFNVVRNYSQLLNEQNKNIEQNNCMIPNNSNISIINNQDENRSFIKEDNINNYSLNYKPPTPQLRNKNKNFFNSPNYQDRSKSITLMQFDDYHNNYNTNSYKSNNQIQNNNKTNGNGFIINNNSYFNQRPNRSFSIDSDINKKYNFSNQKYKRKNFSIKNDPLEGLRNRIQRLDEMLKNANFSNHDSNTNIIFYDNN